MLRAAVAGLAGATVLRAHGDGPQVRTVAWMGSPPDARRRWIAEAFAARGFVEGRNLVLRFEAIPEPRAAAMTESLREMEANSARVLDSRPDVVVISAPDPLLAQQRAVPIVLLSHFGDPELEGLVETLRRPGRNITGSALDAQALTTRQWQLLKDIRPSMKRGAMVFLKETMDADAELDPEGARRTKERWAHQLHRAEAALGIEIGEVLLPSPVSAAQISAAIAKTHAQALWVDLPSGMQGWPEFVKRSKLPTCVFGSFRHVRDLPALVGLTPDQDEAALQTIAIAARVLRGENPAAIPVYMIRDYRITVNLRLAREAGIEIPASVLIQADARVE